MREKSTRIANSRPRGRDRATRQKIVDKLRIDPEADGILWQSPATQRRLKELLQLFPQKTPDKRRRRINTGGKEQKATPFPSLELLFAPTQRTPIIYRVRVVTLHCF